MTGQPQKLLSVKEVANRVGKSESTIWSWTNPDSPYYKPHFPPRHEGESGYVWWDTEVDEYVAARPTMGKKRHRTVVGDTQNAATSVTQEDPPIVQPVGINNVAPEAAILTRVAIGSSDTETVTKPRESQFTGVSSEYEIETDSRSEANIEKSLTSKKSSAPEPASKVDSKIRQPEPCSDPEVQHVDIRMMPPFEEAAVFRNERFLSNPAARSSETNMVDEPLFPTFDMKEIEKGKLLHKIHELLVEKAKKATCIFESEIMRSIGLLPDADGDRKTIQEILSELSRRSHEEHGFMIGALAVEYRPAHQSHPGTDFFALAKSLGYECPLDGERKFFIKQMVLAFEFYEDPKSESGSTKSITLLGGGWHTWTRS